MVRERESSLRISYLSNETKALGPGKRFAIWTQGCKKRCPGCINPSGQALDGGEIISVEKLIQKILSVEGIQGVTISGGEPFLQFEALCCLVHRIKKETELDIMLYSGYQLSELKEMFGEQLLQDFFCQIDIFVDGEYQLELDRGSIYRGSDNQKIYFFTEKYREYGEKICETKNRSLEFEIKEDGTVFMLGIPPKDFYPAFLKKIEERAFSKEEGI